MKAIIITNKRNVKTIQQFSYTYKAKKNENTTGQKSDKSDIIS